MPNQNNDIQVNFIGDTTSIEASINRLKTLMKSFNGSVRTLSGNLADATGTADSAIKRNSSSIATSSKSIVAGFKAEATAATDAASKISTASAKIAAAKKTTYTSSGTDTSAAGTVKRNVKASADYAEYLGVSNGKVIQSNNGVAKSFDAEARAVADYAHYLETGNVRVVTSNKKAKESFDALLEAEKRANLFRKEKATTSVKFDSLQTPIMSTQVETRDPRGRNRASQATGGGITTSAYGPANTKGTVTEKDGVTKLNDALKATTERKKSLLLLTNELAMAETNAALAARKEAKALSESAKAAEEKAKADAHATANSSSARYALYDIARAYGVVSAALLVAAGYSVKAAADMESSFTNVERTLSTSTSVESIGNIRSSLISLSEQIPKTFAEVSVIATLGNQLGVAAEDIVGFTKTVSEFSTVTGIDIQATAQAFGLLGNLLQVPTSRFDNLASSIALVGVNSVATEKQIIAVGEQISAAANGAGFAADEVIGLSGAFASLKVSPEQARSSLTTYFSALNNAVAAGGSKLNNFAKITNMTADELEALVRSGNGGKEVFDAFLGTLNDYGSVEITKSFEELGLNGLRVDNTFRRLAQNPALVGSIFDDASEGMRTGTEAQRQYAMVADDVNSAFTMLQSTLSNLVGQLGSDMLPVITDTITQFKEVVIVFKDISASPVGKVVFGIATAFTVFTGALLAYKSAALIAAGTTLALGRAQALLGGVSTAGAFKTLFFTAGRQLLGFKDVTVAATAATGTLSTVTATSTGVVGANTAVVGANAAATSGKAVATNVSTVATEGNIIATNVSTGAVVANTAATGFWAGALRLLSVAAIGVRTAISAIPGWGWALAGIAGLIALSGWLMDVGKSATIAGIGLSDVAARSEAGGRNLEQTANDAGLVAAAYRDAAKATKEAQDAYEAKVKYAEEHPESPNAGANIFAASIEATKPNAGLEAAKEQIGTLDEELASFVAAGDMEEVAKLLKASGLSAAEAAALYPKYTSALIEARVAAKELAEQQLKEQWGQAVASVNDAEKALADYNSTAKNTQKEVRTLSDYAGDLANIFKRSFDIRFSSQAALDNITSGFADLRKESEAARISLLSLSADKSVKEYFLSIANAYGDTLRAGQLTADIAKINQDIADAQSNASTELKGNSAAAIKNRATMRGMVTSYDAYIQSLADSGASQATLQAAIKQGKADFTAQATQLGYNSDQLGTYSSHFDDLATAVREVPRNVTVTANVNPALQALNEMVAKSKASGADAGSAYGASYYQGLIVAAKKGANDLVRIQLEALQRQYNALNSSNDIAARAECS
mgnify:CR=1 FL=1